MNHSRTGRARVHSGCVRAVLAITCGTAALFALGGLCRAQNAGPDENSLLQDAARSMVAGNLRQAETDLETVLHRNPHEYHALNLLGMIRAQQQRDAEAEKIFNTVIQQKPDFAGAHVNLGLLYLQMSRSDDAIAQFQEALRLEPGREDALGALLNTLRVQARAAVHDGNMEKALALLIQARKASPRNPDVLYDFGIVALRMSLFPDAVEAFHGVLALRPDDANSLYGLGRAQIGLRKYQDAADTFARFAQLYPQDASGHYALGIALASLEKREEARAQFQESVELQPGQTESYLQLGRICLDAGELDCAAADFDRVLHRDPRHAEALAGMGRVEFQRKDYGKAIELLQQSIVLGPANRQAHYYLGLAYARVGRNEDSAKELQVANKIEHDEVEQQRSILKLLDSSQEGDASQQTPQR
jgi:tetratricopeptide (TPR) repeat protein